MAGRKILKPTHLGDGVYIHDRGYCIELAVNHHSNIVISMSHSEIEAFIIYVEAAKFVNLKTDTNG